MRFFRALLPLLLWFPNARAALAQTNAWTPVTATQLSIGNTPLTGTIYIAPVNGYGQPLSITTADGKFVSGALSASVTAGAIANGFSVPDQCTATATTPNSPVSYQVQIIGTSPKGTAVFTIPATAPAACGSTPFALDHYSAPQTAVASAVGIIVQPSVPARCTVPSIYYAPVNPSAIRTCVGGVFVNVQGSGAGLTWGGTWSSVTAYTSGTAVLRNGSSYVALQASTNQDPATATSFWQLVAQKGDDGAPGATGATGATGPTGATGATGPAGADATLGSYAFASFPTTGLTANKTMVFQTDATAASPCTAGGGSVRRLCRYNGTGWDPAESLAKVSATGNYSDLIGAPTNIYSNPVPGASAEWRFLEQTGTTVADATLQGNTATFGAGGAAPTWNGYGVSFHDGGTTAGSYQNISTPITSFGAVYIGFCTPNLASTTGTSVGGVPYTSNAVLWGSSGAGTGLSLQSSNGQGSYAKLAFAPTVFQYSAFNYPTYYTGAVSGCHVVGYVPGTTDHIYMDTVEQAYGAQGSSSTVASTPLTTGTYQIGAGLSGLAAYWRGVITWVTVYPAGANHTAAQAAGIIGYIQANLALRPQYPHYPIPSGLRTPQLNALGDSLTASFLGTAQWTTALALNNSYTVNNLGIGGISAVDTCNLLDQRISAYTAPGNTTTYVWLGTNDVSTGTPPAVTWQALKQCGQSLQARGHRAVIMTMISRTGQDANKNALNALERSDWRSAYNGIVDLAEIPKLGQDGAYADTTNCYQPDSIHLRGPGTGGTGGSCATLYLNGTGTVYSGYGLVAQAVSNDANTHDGSTQSNPNTTTSNAYNMAYVDNYLIDTPSAAATLNLVDCLGQVTPRTIFNGSATNSITVSGVNSETIAGSAVISPNQTAEFTPLLVSPSAGGCSWLRK
ncbi:GDSL-type esterase/lipase family protein [Terriglobus sp. ADX1]|uniref:GDSL-type esterase/lipase family protein n=1 Tax=Terriglobus sp. ADX1 TaxID=2794063 RepID=UPI002FE61268